MVEELIEQGLTGEALEDEVMRLLELDRVSARELICQALGSEFGNDTPDTPIEEKLADGRKS